jgi:hypothetical protein
MPPGGYTMRFAVGLLNAVAPQRNTPPTTPAHGPAAAPSRTGSPASSANSRPSTPTASAKAVVVRIHAAPAADAPLVLSEALLVDRDATLKAAQQAVALLDPTAAGASHVLAEVSIVVSITRAGKEDPVSADVAARIAEAVRSIGLQAVKSWPHVTITRVAATGCGLAGVAASAFVGRLFQSTTAKQLHIGSLDLRSNVLGVADLSKLMRQIAAVCVQPDGTTSVPFHALLLRDNPGAANPAGCRVCQLLLEQLEVGGNTPAARHKGGKPNAPCCVIDVVGDLEGGDLETMSLVSSSAAGSREASSRRPPRSASTSLAPSPDRDHVPKPTAKPAWALPDSPPSPAVVRSRHTPTTPDDSHATWVVEAAAAHGGEGSPTAAATADQSGCCLGLVTGGQQAAMERQHLILAEQWHRAFFVELARTRSTADCLRYQANALSHFVASRPSVLRRLCAAVPAREDAKLLCVNSSVADATAVRLLGRIEATLRGGQDFSAEDGGVAALVASAHAKFTEHEAAACIRRCDYLLAAHDHFCVTGDLLSWEAVGFTAAAPVALVAALPPTETPNRVNKRLEYPAANSDAAPTTPMRHHGMGTPPPTSAASDDANDGRRPKAPSQKERRELKAVWLTLKDMHNEWHDQAAAGGSAKTAQATLPLFGLRLRCEFLKMLVHFRTQLARHEALLADVAALLRRFASQFAEFETRHARLQTLTANRRPLGAQQQSVGNVKQHAVGNPPHDRQHHGQKARTHSGGMGIAQDDENCPVPRSNVPVRNRTPVKLERATSHLKRTPSRVPASSGHAHHHQRQSTATPTSPAATHATINAPAAAVDAAARAALLEEVQAAEAAAKRAAERAVERRRKETLDEQRRQAERREEAHAYVKRVDQRKTTVVAALSTAAPHHHHGKAAGHESAPDPQHQQRFGSISLSPRSEFDLDAASYAYNSSWADEPPRGAALGVAKLHFDADDCDSPRPASKPKASTHPQRDLRQHPAAAGAPRPEWPAAAAVPNTQACRRREAAEPQRLRAEPVSVVAAVRAPPTPRLAEPRCSEHGAAEQKQTDSRSHHVDVMGTDTAPPPRPAMSQLAPATAAVTLPQRAPAAQTQPPHWGAAVASATTALPRQVDRPAEPSRRLVAASEPSSTDAILSKLHASDPQLFATVTAHLRLKEAAIQEKVRERMAGLVATLSYGRCGGGGGKQQPQSGHGYRRPVEPEAGEWC